METKRPNVARRRGHEVRDGDEETKRRRTVGSATETKRPKDGEPHGVRDGDEETDPEGRGVDRGARATRASPPDERDGWTHQGRARAIDRARTERQRGVHHGLGAHDVHRRRRRVRGGPSAGRVQVGVRALGVLAVLGASCAIETRDERSMRAWVDAGRAGGGNGDRSEGRGTIDRRRRARGLRRDRARTGDGGRAREREGGVRREYR